MKWCKRGYVLAAILALASATIQAADVTITVNGKVVAKPCTVSTTNATVDLGDLYSFSLMSAGAASAWHDVALELTNCPVGTSRVTASFSGAADSTGYYKNQGTAFLFLNYGVVFTDVGMAWEIFSLRFLREVVNDNILPLQAFPNGSPRAPVAGALLIWDKGGEFKDTGRYFDASASPVPSAARISWNVLRV